MILSVSQRCDIPAYFSDWFYQRIKEGFADVRAPFNPQLVHRVNLSRENVDLIVFMSKNPLPMMAKLDQLNGYNCCFQITITPYTHDIEKNVADKRLIIEAVRTLSRRYGPHAVIVRYDPILLNQRYTIDYHMKAFQRLCEQLSSAIDTIIFSFVDEYKNTRAHQAELKLMPISESQMLLLARGMAQIAESYGIRLQTCGEKIDLQHLNIQKGSCISSKLLADYGIHSAYPLAKTRGHGCDCLAYTDLGAYNCCAHGCSYCYANYDEAKVKMNLHQHDPMSTMLIGHLKPEDKLVDKRQKVKQTVLF